MMEYLKSTGDVVVDRSAQELIAAIMIALAIALVVSGFYALGRRKVSDSVTLVICLALLASVASMAVAAGYVAGLRRRDPRAMEGAGPRGYWVPPAFRMEDMLARRILEAADGDGDHLLSAEEAAQAAALFVRAAKAGGQGSIDFRTLSQLIRANTSTISDPYGLPRPPGWHGPLPGVEASQRPGNPRRKGSSPVE